MDDQKFDEKTALEWIDTIEGAGSGIREKDIYPILRNWLAQSSPKKIIDIGCGQGVCSEQIDLLEAHYTGLEPSPFLIKRAKELYEKNNCTFLTGSVYQIPFASNVFDAAFSIATWHLLADLATAAQELSRVLKTESPFLIITADPASYSEWTKRYQSQQLDGRRFEGQTKLGDGTVSSDIFYLHSQDEIINSLERRGLQTRKIEKFRHFISLSGHKK